MPKRCKGCPPDCGVCDEYGHCPDHCGPQFYYIQCASEEITGDLVLWWKPQRSGYTTVLGYAGVYTKQEADEIARIRGTDIPRLKSDVDKHSIRVVNIEHYPKNSKAKKARKKA